MNITNSHTRTYNMDTQVNLTRTDLAIIANALSTYKSLCKRRIAESTRLDLIALYEERCQQIEAARDKIIPELTKGV